MKPLEEIKKMKKSELLDYIINEVHPQLIKLHLKNKVLDEMTSAILDNIQDSVQKVKEL